MAGPRRVSVIVPTCNRPRYLREALASIRALEGDDLQFEIIVGDNGSAPETRAIAEAAGAIYIAARGGKGASVARNGAMAAATGSYMAFLDDDDVWLPTNIRSHIAHLETFPQHEAALRRARSSGSAGARPSKLCRTRLSAASSAQTTKCAPSAHHGPPMRPRVRTIFCAAC